MTASRTMGGDRSRRWTQTSTVSTVPGASGTATVSPPTRLPCSTVTRWRGPSTNASTLAPSSRAANRSFSVPSGQRAHTGGSATR